MLKLLRQPFPLTIDTAQRIRTALGFGLFVFLFLFIFRPFGLHTMPIATLAKTALLYGIVCFGVLLSWFLVVPRLFPQIFRESIWTVWKEMLHILTCVLAVACGNITFSHFYFHEAVRGSFVWQFLWWTIAVSILPIILMVLFRQVRLMKTFGRQAAELDRQLATKRDLGSSTTAMPPTPMSPDPDSPADTSSRYALPPISTDSYTSGDTLLPDGLSRQPETFLYAEAADNYVKLFYADEQQLIRTTLKQLEETFQTNPRIFRCHRAYLVNLDKVIHISGNAQGYKLHLEGASHPIPVSRSLNGQIASLVIRPDDPSDS